MSKWKTCTIGDIGTVVGGATPSTKKEENYLDGTISWITPKDLAGFSGRYISRGERNITEIGLNSCSTQLMPAHTVLFSSRAPIGYVAIAENEVCTNQGFKSVIPNTDTDYMFLYYLLKYNKNKIENLGSGTTFKEVSGSTMRNVEINVPETIEEQRKVASILSAIDDKIENNNAINDNLEQQAQALFKKMFPNVLEGTASDCFESIISFSNGKKRPQSEGSVPVYGGNGILAYTSEVNANNCVVIGRVGAYCGNTFLCQGNCWVSDNAIQAKSKNEDSQIFVYYLLKNASLPTRHIGTGQPLMTQGILNAIPISVPEQNAINNFIDNVSPMHKLISANLEENSKLAKTRDFLLPQLMSGELDVSNLDI